MRFLALLVCLVCVPCTAFAVDYHITFAKRKAGAPNNARGVVDFNFDATKPMETWGTTAVDSANFPNNSSKTLMAIEFKGRFDNVKFASDSTGGDLFRQVWVNPDRTRIIFKDATQPVAPGQRFWLKAVPSTQGMGDYYRFEARAHETDPTIPDGWTQLSGDEPHELGGQMQRDATLYKIMVVNNTGTDVVFYLTSAIGELPVHRLKKDEVYISPVPECTPGQKAVAVFDAFTEKLLVLKSVNVSGPTMITLSGRDAEATELTEENAKKKGK